MIRAFLPSPCNRRRAGAACAALAASVSISAAATAQTFPPPVARIEIGRDTVRFVVDPHEPYTNDSSMARYGYVRRTGEWILMERAPGAWRTRLPSEVAPVRLQGGFSLEERSRIGADSIRRGRHVIRAPDGKEYELAPTLDSVAVLSLAKQTGRSEAEVRQRYFHHERAVQAWRQEGDSLWIATSSVWPVLFHFDTRRRALTTIMAPWLADAHVYDLATTRGAVWLAVIHGSGWGIDGRGLARFDRATRQWRLFHPSSSSIPDSSIIAMDGAGDSLWIATPEALAIYDDARGTWDVRWFRVHPELTERTEEKFEQVYTDTVIRPRWTLERQHSPLEHATRVIIDVARHLEIESPIMPGAVLPADTFLTVARALPPEHFARAYRGRFGSRPGGESDIGLALAHPRLVPFMIFDTAHAISRLSRDELRAFGLLGDKRYLGWVQWATEIRSGDSHHDAIAAWTLARLGDSSQVPLLRDLAVESGWNWSGNAIADLLIELGDTVIVDRVLDYIRTKGHILAWDWVRRNVNRERWRSLVKDAAQTPDDGYMLLSYLARHARDSVRLDPAIRPATAQMIRNTLVPIQIEGWAPRSAKEFRESAYRLAHLTRDTAVIPQMIEQLTRDSADYVAASTVLANITGTDAAPGGPGSPMPVRIEAQRFWTAWWERNRRTFVQPPADSTRAAMERWSGKR